MQRSPSACSINNLPVQPLFSEDSFNSTFPTEPSTSTALAATISDLSEHPQLIPVPSMLQCSPNFPVDNWNEDMEQSHRLPDPGQNNRWMIMNHGPDPIEPDTSYSNSSIGMARRPLPEGVSMVSGHIIPANFEDQLMLTMAVPVAEAGARMNSMDLMWL